MKKTLGFLTAFALATAFYVPAAIADDGDATRPEARQDARDGKQDARGDARDGKQEARDEGPDAAHHHADGQRASDPLRHGRRARSGPRCPHRTADP